MPILYTLFILCLFGGTTALYPNCATIKTLQEFDIIKYSGEWFVASVYSSTPKPISNPPQLSCGTINFNIESNETFKLINVVAQGPYRTIVNTTKTGCIASLDVSARFRMKDDEYGVEYDEVVVDTDYNSYAVTYRCADKSESDARLAFILTRVPKPSLSTLGKLVQIVIQNDINQLSVTLVNHTRCNLVYPSHLGQAQGSVDC